MAKAKTLASKFPRTGMDDLLIDANHIAANTITATELAAGAVTAAAIAAGTITGTQIAVGTITGANVSGTISVKIETSAVPTVPTAAGTTEVLMIMPFAGVITAINFVCKDALATSNSNYVTFAGVNKGQAGAGSTALLAATAANTTQTTGGAAQNAYTTRQLALAVVGNLTVAANDVVAFQITGTGTLANALTEGQVLVGINVQT